MAKSDSGFDPTTYAPVAERIRLFWESFPNGRITTRLVSRTDHDVVFVACIYRTAEDTKPATTGWAAEREGDGDINTVACLENTETSAVGRALANLGFTAAKERPSVEEMQKAARARSQREKRPLAEGAHPGFNSSPRHPAALDADREQRRANAVSDVLPLVRAAERCGLRPRRAEAIRRRLLADATSQTAVDGIARLLRRWIRKRVHEEIRSLAHAPRE